MRVFHSVVIREKPPSKRPRQDSSLWLVFAFQTIGPLDFPAFTYLRNQRQTKQFCF